MRIRPLCEADREEAARVYVAGFLEEEIRPVMPRHMSHAEALFAEIIRPSAGSYAAVSEDEEIVGLAFCLDAEGDASHAVDWRLLRRHLPLIAATRARIVCGYFYNVHPAGDELRIRALVVKASWQGRGVGTHLVNFACAEATRRGLARATLNVVDQNVRARSLYERLGFVTVNTTPTGRYRLLVGWSAIDHMEKALRQTAEKPATPA